jgi:hypothetical protein
MPAEGTGGANAILVLGLAASVVIGFASTFLRLQHAQVCCRIMCITFSALILYRLEAEGKAIPEWIGCMSVFGILFGLLFFAASLRRK